MRKTNSQNLRLGIFVVTGMLIFILAVYYIGNKQNLFGNTTEITSVFKNVNGLQPGNNVRFSGVNVGTVKGITILNDTAIVVDMTIQNKVMGLIKRNSLTTISSDGLVGSMIVNIIPGDYIGEAPVQAGDTLLSISKIATADMLTTLNTTNENAALLTADLLRITTAINKGEGLVGALIKDEKMATEIKQSISNINAASRSALQTVNRLNKIVSEVDMDNSVAGVLLKDSISAQNVSGIIESLKGSAEEINEITVNLNAFSNELKNNEGVLNFVMKDTTFVKNLDQSMKNIEEASKKLEINMEALQHNFLFRGYFRRLERQKEKGN